MPTLVYYGNGVQTRFEVPGSAKKTVLVNGTGVTPASSDFQSVTLAAAPGQKVPVQIDWDADGVTPDGGPTGIDAQIQSLVSAAGNYDRVALLASPGPQSVDVVRAAPSTMTGTYTGTGALLAVELGWRPDFVVIKAGNTEQARFWSSASWYGRTDAFTNLDSTGQGITPTETGFTVGTAASVNTSAATHHYFAYKDNGAGGLLHSSQHGNATAGRTVGTYAGIPLKFAMFKRDSTTGPEFAIKGKATSSDYIGTLAANAVIGADGTITLSAANSVNQWSVNLGEGCMTLAVPDDSGDVHAFTYVGNATGRRIPLPWLPDWLLIQPRGSGSGASGQMWFSSLSAGQHLPTGPGAAGTGRIASVDGSALLLNTANQVNANGVEFACVAFRRSRVTPAQRRVPQVIHTKAVQIASGGYIDCGTSDSLMFSGAGTWEWLGAVYPASTTPFAGGVGADNEADKQFPLFCRSLGADVTDSAVSWALAAMCPRPEGVGVTGADWSGASICWSTQDRWQLPQTTSPVLDNYPAYSGIVMPSGELTHILVTHDGAGGWRLAVNGRIVKERKRDLVAAIGRANGPGFSGHRTVIGARQRAASIDFGHAQQVRLVRVYSRVMTAQQMADQYRAIFGLTAAASDYLEEWDMRNASGASVPASRSSANNGTLTSGVVIG